MISNTRHPLLPLARGTAPWFADKATPERILTRSGRDAVFVLLRQFEDQGRKKSALLPANVPEGMISPFIKRGWTVSFYALGPDLGPPSDLGKTLTRTRPDLIVLVHMYGLSFNFAPVIAQAHAAGCSVLEDFSHFWPEAHISPTPPETLAYTLVSLPKLIGVPDGAILTAQSGQSLGPAPKASDPIYALRVWILLHIGARPKPFKIYRLLQRALGRLLDPYRRLQSRFASDPRLISDLSHSRLSHVAAREAAAIRQRHWRRYASELPRDLLLPLDHRHARPGLSFGFPLLHPEADKLTATLAAQGIQVTRLRNRWDFTDQISDIDTRAGARHVLNTHLILPLQEHLSDAEITRIIKAICAFHVSN